MNQQEIVATFKELSAGLGIPAPAGEAIEVPDWDGLGCLLTEVRMLEPFVRSLPLRYQTAARRALGREYTGRFERQRRVRGDVEGFGGIDPNDVARLSVDSTVSDTVSVEGRFPVYWHYMCGVVFLRDVETGMLTDHWGGVSVKILSPLGNRADPPDELVEELLGFLLDAAVLSGALGGGAAWAQRGLGTHYLHPRGELQEPELLENLHWITLFGPRITERLGGVGALEASGVFHQVRAVPYRDGHTGALVRVCHRASTFDAADPAVATFLRPVLKT